MPPTAATFFNPPEHQRKPYGKPGPQILSEERAKASFSSGDLTRYLHGDEYLARKAKILPLLKAEPTLDKEKVMFLGRTEKVLYGLQKEKTLYRLAKEHNWDSEDATMAEVLMDMSAVLGLHKSMFWITLTNATTPEQKKLFLEPALNYDIIGCYSQTEMGHGSNVQGLETTATYNPAKKTFTMNSPTLTAAKWWSGGLGTVADHSVVMAQLLTPGPDGKLINQGPHTFVVPIRDIKTREVLPGRIIGDIGPKAGFNMVDNGTMLLDNVEIPHINFLAKHAQVDINTGAYTKPPSAKLSYGTMTVIRAGIIKAARTYMARAAIVAIRYCSIRHQFADKDAPEVPGVETPETAVINYQIVQARIFPALAASFAFHFTQKDFYALYEENEAAVAKGDYSLGPDVHASATGLKSICTIMTAHAIEECRKACGGHGYSSACGLGPLFQEYVPTVTWEGDSYMLTQQVGRYLFKTYRALRKNPETVVSHRNRTGTYLLKFFSDPDASASFTSASALSDPETIIAAFGHRAAFLIAEAVNKQDNLGASWNDLLVDIYRCSVAHSQYVLMVNFAAAITSDPELAANKPLHKIMSTMFEYFAVLTLDAEVSEFILSGFFNKDQYKIIRARLRELLAEVRPQAVALADGWGLDDYEVNSILGSYEGDVYPGMIKFLKKDPVNYLLLNPDPRSPDLVMPATPYKAHF